MGRSRVLEVLFHLAVALALFLAIPAAPRAGTSAGNPPAKRVLVEGLGGEGRLERNASTTPAQLKPGSEVPPGERVSAGQHSSAKLLFPNGTRLLLGQNTTVIVGSDLESVTIEQGDTRVAVPKEARSAAAANPHKFRIRSRTAVMGVRGTDFVVTVDPASAETMVATLSGVVEVARDDRSLREGKFRTVDQNRWVVADGKELSSLRALQPDSFLAAFERKQPELAALAASDREVFRPEYGSENLGPRLSLLAFRAGAVVTRQRTGHTGYSPQLSWTPAYRLSGPWSLRGNAGLLVLRDRAGDRFPGLELALSIQFRAWERWTFGAGAGVESWIGYAKPGPVGLADVAWRVGQAGPLEALLYFGVTYFPGSPVDRTGVSNPATQLKTGIGVTF